MNYIITPGQINKLKNPIETVINSELQKMKNDPEIFDDMENMDIANALNLIEKIKVKKIDFIDENFRIFLDIYVYEDLYYGLSDVLNEIKYKLKKMLPYTISFNYDTIETSD